MQLDKELPEGAKVHTSSKKETSEVLVWLVISILIIIYLFGNLYFKELKFNENIGIRGGLSWDTQMSILYHSFFSAFLLFFVPILFKQIFGLYPFEFIRSYRQALAYNSKQRATKIASIESAPSPSAHEAEIKNSSSKPNKPTEPENYQLLYIEESRAISIKIFDRAGAYLLAGCLVAFLGLAYLNYSLIANQPISNVASEQVTHIDKTDSTSTSKAIPNKSVETSSETNKNVLTEIEQRLLDYLPRFGTLLLVELIAFFFLRQYRITSEEYRYYEAVKRKRQDNFILLNIIKDNSNSPEILKIIQDLFVDNLSSHKLGKEETTQIIETQKLLNQETDILNKFVELAKTVKSK